MGIRRWMHYGWVTSGLAVGVVFASLGLARFGYSSVLPAMQEALGLDNTAAGALATANLVGYVILSVAGGALASRFGPRVVITAGLATVACGMFLTGLAGGFASAGLWRAVTGAGSGASNVPVMGLISAWSAPRRRGLLAGIAVSGSSVGLIVLGPGVPALLARAGPDGWRTAWFAFAAAAAALAVVAGALLRNRPAELGLAPLGADGAADAGSGRADEDRPRPSVYRDARVWRLGLVYAAFGFSYIIYLTFFVKRLVADAGCSPGEAGRLFMAMGWCSLVCGVLWGGLSDRIGRRWALVGLYLTHAVSFGLFGGSRGGAGATVSAALFGLSAWSVPAIMAAASGDVMGPRLAPAALGFITLFFGLGQALGPLVAGALADRTGSLSMPLLLSAAVALAGAAGAATLRDAAPARRR